MPTRTVPYLRGKAVFVAVLVEGPTRRRNFSQNNSHDHHVKPANANGSRGYNRKAQLLEYSRHLRASAPSVPLIAPSQPNTVQRQNSQIVAVKSKPKYARVPTCLGNWKLVLPRFLQSFTMPERKKSKNHNKKKSMASTTTKMKAIVKTFRVERRIGLFSKLFGKLRKHHY